MEDPRETSNNDKDLPIFVKWLDFLKWLLLTTDKFPKKARFTFSDRINNLALNIVEDLVEARYTKQRGILLARTNLNLEKLRVLIRISYELKFFSFKAYEQATYSINEVGRMLGGWLKQQESKGGR